MANNDIKVTPDQQYIYDRFSKCIGQLLLYIESAVPGEMQCKSLKKLVENRVYQTRDELIARFGEVKE
ncbi:hypothetical protein HYS94_01925 [Candidatus Daviesbacteria bacterium]|nr:hypothetical protein [Candidatus Daviesbacteria bacterium]